MSRASTNRSWWMLFRLVYSITDVEPWYAIVILIMLHCTRSLDTLLKLTHAAGWRWEVNRIYIFNVLYLFYFLYISFLYKNVIINYNGVYTVYIRILIIKTIRQKLPKVANTIFPSLTTTYCRGFLKYI